MLCSRFKYAINVHIYIYIYNFYLTYIESKTNNKIASIVIFATIYQFYLHIKSRETIKNELNNATVEDYSQFEKRD